MMGGWMDEYFTISNMDSPLNTYKILVGGWATPLKNMSQLGWISFKKYGRNMMFQTTNQDGWWVDGWWVGGWIEHQRDVGMPTEWEDENGADVCSLVDLRSWLQSRMMPPWGVQNTRSFPKLGVPLVIIPYVHSKNGIFSCIYIYISSYIIHIFIGFSMK